MYGSVFPVPEAPVPGASLPEAPVPSHQGVTPGDVVTGKASAAAGNQSAAHIEGPPSEGHRVLSELRVGRSESVTDDMVCQFLDPYTPMPAKSEIPSYGSKLIWARVAAIKKCATFKDFWEQCMKRIPEHQRELVLDFGVSTCDNDIMDDLLMWDHFSSLKDGEPFEHRLSVAAGGLESRALPAHQGPAAPDCWSVSQLWLRLSFCISH